MAVRNCKELGVNLQKIVNRLLANNDLVNLLYYTDKDPLSGIPLTDEQKRTLIFDKLIKIVPRIGPKENARSIVALRVANGRTINANTEFRVINISFEIIVPLTQWMIKDSNLRPFAIMGEIEESLKRRLEFIYGFCIVELIIINGKIDKTTLLYLNTTKNNQYITYLLFIYKKIER